MKLQLLLFLLLAIVSISLLSLQVDGRKLLLQKNSKPMKQGSDNSKAKFHDEHPGYESFKGVGESGKGVPCDYDEDNKGESEEIGDGDYCFEGNCEGKGGEGDEEQDDGYYEGSDAGDNQGDDSKDSDNNDDNGNNSGGNDGKDQQDSDDQDYPGKYGVNMKKLGD